MKVKKCVKIIRKLKDCEEKNRVCLKCDKKVRILKEMQYEIFQFHLASSSEKNL